MRGEVNDNGKYEREAYQKVDRWLLAVDSILSSQWPSKNIE